MAHIPVLLKEVLEGLALKPGMTVLDATLGGGGHTREICKIIGQDGMLIGLDRDSAAIERVKKILSDECKYHLFVANFKDLSTVLNGVGLTKLDAALFDLGLSSFQLDDSGRGFTFQKDEPLLMTFEDKIEDDKLTAKEIVNTWAEESLADIIYGYGGERFARRIAKGIVEERKKGEINTTKKLVDIIEKCVPAIYKRRKIHFATKTFQAIRITVNDEMTAIRKGLDDVWQKLGVGGRIAVIAFHEIEDRIVKNFFKNKKETGVVNLITKKPLVPSEDEMINNPRSRSAKLRIAQKIDASI